MPYRFTRARVLRGIYALCLAGATYNHIVPLLQHGLLWDYYGMPLFYATFWTSLTVCDPLAIICLFAWPTTGTALTAAIIIVDVAVNTAFALGHPFDQAAVISQWIFLVFVLSTLTMARQDLRWRSPRAH